MGISFFTAVSYGGVFNNRWESLLEKVDDYFYLGGRKAQVIRGNKVGNSEGVTMVNASAMYTTIKKVSYFTFLIPAIALAVKAVLRCYHKFHLIQNPNQQVPKSVVRPARNIPPKNNDDRVRPPSAPPVDPLNERLNDEPPPNAGPVPPSSPPPESAISGKPVPPSGPAPDDTFEPMPPPYFPSEGALEGVPNQMLQGQPAHAQLIAFDTPTRLSAAQAAALRIIPTSFQDYRGLVPGASYQFGRGFSTLMEYQDSIFTWKRGTPDEVVDDDLLQGMVIKKPFDYEITRLKLDRDYPALPLNTSVRLPVAAHDNLQLTLESFTDGLCCGTSEIEEYLNSEIKWREAEDGSEGCIYTRTLKENKML